MSKDKARMLLDSVVSFGYAQAAVDGQGNSGEFYDRREAKECEKKLEKAKAEFISTFAATTGWKPIWHEPTEASQWTERWSLEKA